MDDNKVAVIVGIGPGLGGQSAVRFAKERYAVGLMARNQEKLDPVTKEIESAGGRAFPVTADTTDPESVSGTFSSIRAELGDPSVLIYNAGAFEMNSIMNIAPKRFKQC